MAPASSRRKRPAGGGCNHLGFRYIERPTTLFFRPTPTPTRARFLPAEGKEEEERARPFFTPADARDRELTQIQGRRDANRRSARDDARRT